MSTWSLAWTQDLDRITFPYWPSFVSTLMHFSFLICHLSFIFLHCAVCLCATLYIKPFPPTPNYFVSRPESEKKTLRLGNPVDKRRKSDLVCFILASQSFAAKRLFCWLIESIQQSSWNRFLMRYFGFYSLENWTDKEKWNILIIRPVDIKSSYNVIKIQK